ncbi:phosphatase PAP2 family protein [Speluncibacter jeojiensis]|uniref:phosphatase PAP2 family protein n=1 Tax=Speluncibacter jeojiensis TaxID=2710754 RepID=UPI0038CD8E30
MTRTGPSPRQSETVEPAAVAAAQRRRRRLTAVRWTALGIWLAVVVFRTWTTGLAFNRELLLLYICTGLIAASIGRRRVLLVVRDWLPFALILIVYDLSRGAATLIGRPTLWTVQPAVDRWLFFGHEPTVWLQEHLKLPQPPWWEVIISTVYMSFFILPYVVAGVLWLRNRADWRAFVVRFVTLSFVSLIVYAIVPAAPPWAAARCTAAQVAGGPSNPDCMSAAAGSAPGDGLLGAMHALQPGAHSYVERLSTRGFDVLHLHAASALLDEGQAGVNQVAAIPSLHAALSAMVAVFLWTRVRRRWRPLLAAYALTMAFTLVYAGEHYVFDILLGWATAAIVLVVISRLERRALDRRAHPRSVDALLGAAPAQSDRATLDHEDQIAQAADDDPGVAGRQQGIPARPG